MDINELTRKIIKNKENKHHFIEDTLIYNVIETIRDYICCNLDGYNKYQRAKANARIEAYEDCIKLLEELLYSTEEK